MKRLSHVQERVLLIKHCTGDFPARQFATIRSLLEKGMLQDVNGRLCVTPQGKAYCDAHHSTIKM